ncbi:MAG: hypothetical protein ACRD4B_00390, partial [Acidobacteriota bacterium]
AEQHENPEGMDLAIMNIKDFASGDVIRTPTMEGTVRQIDAQKGILLIERPNKQGTMEQKEIPLEHMQNVLQKYKEAGFTAEVIKTKPEEALEITEFEPEDMERAKQAGHTPNQPEQPTRPLSPEELAENKRILQKTLGPAAQILADKASEKIDSTPTAEPKPAETFPNDIKDQPPSSPAEQTTREGIIRKARERDENLNNMQQEIQRVLNDSDLDNESKNRTVRELMKKTIGEQVAQDTAGMFDGPEAGALSAVRQAQEAARKAGKTARLKQLQKREQEIIKNIQKRRAAHQKRLEDPKGDQAA